MAWVALFFDGILRRTLDRIIDAQQVRQNQHTAGLEQPRHFLQNLLWAMAVMQQQAAEYSIKAIITERQCVCRGQAEAHAAHLRRRTLQAQQLRRLQHYGADIDADYFARPILGQRQRQRTGPGPYIENA